MQSWPPVVAGCANKVAERGQTGRNPGNRWLRGPVPVSSARTL